MGQATTDRFTGLGAVNAQGALLGAASLVVVIVALALVLLGVTSGEVAATVLFLPVFAAGVLGGRPAGYAAAGVATVLYVALRKSDLSSAGMASAGVLTLTRAAAYGVAGHVGALARVLLPESGAAPAAARPPSRRPGGATARRPGDRRTAERRTGERRTADATQAHDDMGPAWDSPWPGERTTPIAARDRGRPVLAGVGSAGPGGYTDGVGEPGDDISPPTTMSGGWPPEPRRGPWRDEASGQTPVPDPGGGTGGWDDDDSAGWPGGGAGGAGNGGSEPAPWPSGGEERPLQDESWAAVQQSWREQHGVPEDESARFRSREPAPSEWPHGAADAPRAGGPDHRPPGDPWNDTAVGPPADPWNDTAAAPPADPWGAPAFDPSTGAPSTGPGPDAWDAPGPGEGWNGGGGEWAPPVDDRAWRPQAPAGEAPGASDDPWAGTAPTGGTWPDPAPGGGGWQAPDAPAADWGQQPPRAGWADATVPEQAWDQGPAAEQAWDQGHAWDQGPATAPEGWGDDQPWSQDPPPGGPQHVDDGWGAPAADGGGWGDLAGDAWPTTGQTEAAWDDPAPDHRQPADHWASPAGDWAAGGAAAGAAFGGPGGGGAPPPQPHAPLPAVDPETGLWTAQFLRDRLTAERARSRRTGGSFSLVLVQVPDGPLAQLPYRRQLTLLRELGYQFVAGGVVDHLVHVPDQAQHWFAVILPDTDRSGAQVIERRLRLGIGGYLSSRGLRLRELESASLTAPDDDPAMGAIWEGLIGPDDGDRSPSPGGAW